MAQLTIRLPDELAAGVRDRAADEGKSVNRFVLDAMRALVDPDLEESDVERIRARLRRAGLLHEPERRRIPRADPEALDQARRAAGRGKPLSEYVIEGRGPR